MALQDVKWRVSTGDWLYKIFSLKRRCCTINNNCPSRQSCIFICGIWTGTISPKPIMWWRHSALCLLDGFCCWKFTWFIIQSQQWKVGVLLCNWQIYPLRKFILKDIDSRHMFFTNRMKSHALHHSMVPSVWCVTKFTLPITVGIPKIPNWKSKNQQVLDWRNWLNCVNQALAKMFSIHFRKRRKPVHPWRLTAVGL